MAALQPTLAPTFDPANSPTYDMSSYLCRWNNCSASFVTFGQIIEHIRSSHTGRLYQQYKCAWFGGCGGEFETCSRERLMQHLALYVWRKTIPCICGLEVVKAGTVLLSHYHKCERLQRSGDGVKEIWLEYCSEEILVNVRVDRRASKEEWEGEEDELEEGDENTEAEWEEDTVSSEDEWELAAEYWSPDEAI